MTPSAARASYPPAPQVSALAEDAGVDTAYDSLRIGNYTYDTALAELERQAKDPKQGELHGRAQGQAALPSDAAEREGRLSEQGKVFTAMAAIFRSRPQDIARSVKEVRSESRRTRSYGRSVQQPTRSRRSRRE